MLIGKYKFTDHWFEKVTVCYKCFLQDSIHPTNLSNEFLEVCDYGTWLLVVWTTTPGYAFRCSPYIMYMYYDVERRW